MNLRDATVFARCNEDGKLLTENGRVEIRYGVGKSKAYRAGASNLEADASSDEIFADSHCETNTSTKKAAKKSASISTSHLTEPVGDEVIAYCDGACSGNPGPAGVGAVMRWDKEEQELSEYIGEGTNNIAELLAIQRVLEGVPDTHRRLLIHTDSSYSIGVLTKGWKAKANKELIAIIRALLADRTGVELIHVRGHQGIELNEKADELAVEAVQSRQSAGWVKR